MGIRGGTGIRGVIMMRGSMGMRRPIDMRRGGMPDVAMYKREGRKRMEKREQKE